MTNVSYNEVYKRFELLTSVNKRKPDWNLISQVIGGKAIPDTEVDGVYYLIIGKPSIIYTAHYDTAGDSNVSLISKEYMPHIVSNGNAGILGADDKAGATVLSFMIEHEVPGLYLFFGDEESGASQSRDWAETDFYTRYNLPIGSIKAAIAFDRKGYSDVIQTQRSKRCCSMEYAETLSTMLSMGGFHYRPTDGLFTDTANMVYKIPECTNISIGYFNQHTSNEEQDMLFLWRMVNFMVNNHKSISEIPAFKEVEVYKQYVPVKTFGHNYYSTGDVRLSNGQWYSEALAKKKVIHKMTYLITIGNLHPIMDCLVECYEIFESEVSSDIICEVDGNHYLHLTADNFEEFELEFVSCIPNIMSKQQIFKIDCYKFMATILSAIDLGNKVYIDMNHTAFKNNYTIKYSESFIGHVFSNQLDEFIEASDGLNEELQRADGCVEELPEFID